MARTRTPLTPYQRCDEIVKRIAKITGQTWTFGYIGNCDAHYDDRAWYAFRRTGDVGTAADRIGGHATADLDKLATALGGALKMAMMLNPNRDA